jgi:hypothetical protein
LPYFPSIWALRVALVVHAHVDEPALLDQAVEKQLGLAIAVAGAVQAMFGVLAEHPRQVLVGAVAKRQERDIHAVRNLVATCGVHRRHDVVDLVAGPALAFDHGAVF